MPVLLTTSKSAKKIGDFWRWFAIATDSISLGEDKHLNDIGERLEATCDTSIGEIWLSVGKFLSDHSTAYLAHTPSCVFNASDFGQMLIWAKLIGNLNKKTEKILCICDDPWMFRHLKQHGIAVLGKQPPLWRRNFKLIIRGYLVRGRKAFQLFWTCFRLKLVSAQSPKLRKVILVYGHPESTVGGQDGYFGSLMDELPELIRLLHVDCNLTRTQDLCDGKRTFSLHIWGNPVFAFLLPLMKWRPPARHLVGDYAWLIRRSAELEGSTAQAAMICWQNHCQTRWIKYSRPKLIMWPWENQSWERNLVSEAHKEGINTVGYQHTTIGIQAYNYSFRSNYNNFDSIPELILTTGPETFDRLLEMGYPKNRMRIGGALRVKNFAPLKHDLRGPIFIALPFDREIGLELMKKIQSVSDKDSEFIVKPHPMTPIHFSETSGVKRTIKPLSELGPLSAVVYSATTVGLEAIIGGLPTFRFLPSKKVAMNILPPKIETPTLSQNRFEEVLFSDISPVMLKRKYIFSLPDLKLWRDVFNLDYSN